MFVLAVAEPAEAPVDGGGLGVSPAIILVFGFVFLIILQAWFVRHMTRLRARRGERKSSYEKLREEVVTLADQVASLNRAMDANTVSITTLERETQVLQKLIDDFLAQHQELAAAAAARDTGGEGEQDEDDSLGEDS